MSVSRQYLVLSLILLVNPRIFAADGESFGTPTPNVPELKELNRFVGKWEGQLGNSEQKIPSTRKWVLAGQFVKHEFHVSSGALEGIIYRGYDKKNHQYTMTFLDSTGNASLLTGTWDASLKSMVFEAVNSDCFIQKYESYFPDEGTEQWTITFDSEKQGQVTGIAKKQ